MRHLYKRPFLTMTLLLAGVLLHAAQYGLLLNGKTFISGTENPEPLDPTFQEYVIKSLALQEGEYVQLYDKDNQAAWAVKLDPSSVQGIEKSGNQYNCTKTACYDFYIKLKYQEDQLYVGKSERCDTTYYIAGNGGGSIWCCGVDWVPDGCLLENGTKTFYSLPAGKYEFKITNGTWDRSWGGESIDDSCSTAGYVVRSGGNIAFQIAETSDVTVTFDYGQICLQSTQVFVPTYVSSVPSQCEDVLMQGFYWNSYEVNDTIGNGTDLYGDTKWKTLYAQSSELGAYFDLIWLPPSAMGSGTGYHPRQYSNQNSAWGSRTELEKLIGAFHNSGTKVVADMVLNHSEAMAGWCDMAKENFGEYGVFEPDASWICNTDEMNWKENDADSLANDCYGKATGAQDDGIGEHYGNYASARDWAHDQKNVRDMMRAYATWMRKVIQYDGFRYDECKGYHNSHVGDYNSVSEAYISFMELWSGNGDIIQGIQNSGYNTMALDFQTRWNAICHMAGWNYRDCKQDQSTKGLLGEGYSKYAITFVDSHDWFLRPDSENEFGGRGNSMKPELKGRLLQANAYILSMPGVPEVFYPHWYQYKDEIKKMIRARHLAGVHSESEVKDEIIGNNEQGYQATIVGKYGWLILQLGNKSTFTPWDSNYQLIAQYGTAGDKDSYAIWVYRNTGELAPRVIVTPSADFTDSVAGIQVHLESVAGSAATPILFYTLDGTDPTTESDTLNGQGTLTFHSTTTLKVMAMGENATSKVQTYTYTYHEKPAEGITVRFNKPDNWDKVYLYAWDNTIQGEDTTFVNYLGQYPGTRIYEDADGWYSYQFSATLDSVNFRINAGYNDSCGTTSGMPCSNDLLARYDVCYGWGVDEERLINCDTVLAPDFDLSISPESSIFRDTLEGLKVTLTAVGNKNAVIYYTLDGTEPTTGSESAAGQVQITIHQSTTIKAYAYIPENKETSTPATATPVYTATYTYQPPQTGPITVRFLKPSDWEKLHIYAFTRVLKDGKNIDTPFLINDKGNTKWPGPSWTTKDLNIADSCYMYTFNDVPGDLKDFYVIFNIGSNKKQTQDIWVYENTCFYWSNDCWTARVSPSCDGKTPIDEVKEDNPSALLDPTLPLYNVLGMPVDNHYQGFVIQNGQKYLMTR